MTDDNPTDKLIKQLHATKLVLAFAFRLFCGNCDKQYNSSH